MKKRVIIFSTAYFPLVGGAEVAMKEVTDRLPDFQFDMIVARIRPGLSDEEQIGTICVHRVGLGRPIDKYLLPILGVWKACRLACADEVHAIWSLMASYNGFATLVYTWVRPKTKVLLTLQEGDPTEYILKRVGIFKPWFVAIFKRANKIQAISKFLADWAVQMGHPDRPEVVPNGVDLERYGRRISMEERAQLRRAMGYADEDIVLVTTSRLVKKNAVDDVIRALPDLPSTVKFYVMGEGEEQEMLSKLIQDSGVSDRVALVGKKSQDEIPRLLQACDIFIRPSLSEGQGVSFMEAMAVGLPIIATPVGGIPEFLMDGETGVFCQPRDPASIVRAVTRLIDHPDVKRRIVEQGRRLVEEKYDWNKIAKRMNEILNEL